ncbi:MAG: glycosyltransferase family 9 protein, partial [Bacteroidota bacterium]
RASRVVLSHDTGLMHIAAAFRKPIVSVWGNTVPAFGMTPYMPGEEHRSLKVEVEGLRCRPCTKIGYDRCPKGHFDCIRTINDQFVAKALTSAWSM